MMMKRFSLLLLALLAALPAQTHGRQEDVRDAFLITRAKAPGKPASKAPPPKRGAKAAPLGLGVTLFQEAADGSAVRVPLTKEFRQGDAVRFLIEANASGYLYIFHAENDGPPEMIFPDARLNGGRNAIAAHVPYEVPSSREADPAARWFRFDAKPAIERLHVIVTRTPLADVPTGRALVAWCGARGPACLWRPETGPWTQLVASAGAAREETSATFGQAQAAVEREAAERGLGLGLNAPAPAFIRLSATPGARQLVTSLSLQHK